MLARTAAIRRAVALRQYSRSAVMKEPKLHKAKGNWEAIVAARPIDEDETHVSFFSHFALPQRFRIPFLLTHVRRRYPLSFRLCCCKTKQKVFHPPFNKAVIVGLVAGVVGIGEFCWVGDFCF